MSHIVCVYVQLSVQSVSSWLLCFSVDFNNKECGFRSEVHLLCSFSVTVNFFLNYVHVVKDKVVIVCDVRCFFF